MVKKETPTLQMVEASGRQCLLIAGDVGDERFCKSAVEQTFEKFGKLDILVNNAAEQQPRQGITEITAEQFERTFRTNISLSYMTMTGQVLRPNWGRSHQYVSFAFSQVDPISMEGLS